MGKTYLGIDWGEGQSRAAATVVRVEGGQIGVLESFTIPDREVEAVKRLGLPQDGIFEIPHQMRGEIGLNSIVYNHEVLFRLELPWGRRNPSPAVLRAWWVHQLGRSNKSFRRTSLSVIRRRWRQEAWNPAHKRLVDLPIRRFRMLESQPCEE